MLGLVPLLALGQQEPEPPRTEPAPAPSAARAEVPPAAGEASLSAERTTFDQVAGEVVFSGGARFSDGAALLEADEIRYSHSTGQALASGHVALTRGSERLLADSLRYWRSDKSFAAENIRLGRAPYYIEGASAEGTLDEVQVNEARLSAREPGPFQPKIEARSLHYSRASEIVARRARFGVGEFTPIVLPKFTYKLSLPLASSLSFDAGYRSSLGAFTELGLFLPLGPDTRVGAVVSGYTKRGVMLGPGAHYESEREGGLITAGDLQTGFIRDHGARLTDRLGRAVPEDRGYVQWWHAQDLSERLQLSAQLNYWEDSEVLRDFRPSYFYRNQQPDNYVQLVYAADRFFVSGLARARPNDFQSVQERLPELRFDLPATPLGLGGLYGRFNASAAALRERPPGTGGIATRSDRLDTYVAISRPWARGDWFSFSPIVGARATHYAKATGGKRRYTRLLGEFGFDAALRASRTWDYKNAVWQIDGIRHLLSPTLGYRYVPQAQKGRAWIPPVDTLPFSSYLPVLGLGDARSVDVLEPHHLLRLGLNNTWQTRAADYGSRDLLVLNLAQDLRFDRAAGQRRGSDLHGLLVFTPAPWVQFDVYQRTQVEDLSLRELNVGLTLRDGEAWALRLQSHFLRGELNEYVLGYELALNEALTVLTRLHYDARRSRFNEQAYGLRQNLGNIWSLQYTVSIYDGRRRESDFGFNFSVQALGF
ncbi:hypothetical protein AXK11_08070 [Cephaloticoccus primus]|uniref:LptD C-terminal domain-containing protein n=1 Tax=Cephaloticoccus primus TaxID=1548207 RepID=A0A139SJC7_9BACT|nr:LPS assembly protein LptD [Cephaloticoccus primus]KXU34675.1 hypothetical protein AXK11_08070 [Cephaloticoccus primus]